MQNQIDQKASIYRLQILCKNYSEHVHWSCIFYEFKKLITQKISEQPS